MNALDLKKHMASFFYKDVELDGRDYGRPVIEDVPKADSDFERICKIIFKPDEITGNPSSEVLYVLKGADDGFKNFIKENLMKPLSQSAFAESSDVALDLVKRNLDTADQYQELLSSYVTNMIQEE